MKEVLKVEGMSCGHCVNSIESSVGKLEGVTSVKVDLANNEVTVEFYNEKTLNQIKEKIEDQGYEVA